VNVFLLRMKKRGLSNLVATVLIILLALAAVALVWSFLQPSFERTGTTIDLQTQCLNVNIRPVSCLNSTDNSNATVNVQYNGGDLSAVVAVVEYDDKSTAVQRYDGSLMALATVPVVVSNPDSSNRYPVGASVAAVVSNGVEELPCTESATKVSCS
ncbi:MAG: hypothetical protein KC506_01115, partial [Nanoarchaeota archaeon]|nr:hypothetical protein [Nanoarchaeota archaeon]